jgi:pectate lyase
MLTAPRRFWFLALSECALLAGACGGNEEPGMNGDPGAGGNAAGRGGSGMTSGTAGMMAGRAGSAGTSAGSGSVTAGSGGASAGAGGSGNVSGGTAGAGTAGGAGGAIGTTGGAAGSAGSAGEAGGGGSAGAAGAAGVSGEGAGGAGKGGASGKGGAAGAGAGAGGAGNGGASGKGGSGGAAGGGGSGGSGNAPCAVPAYIVSEAAPIGWASESGGTTGGGNATPVLVTSLSQFKSEVSGATAKVIYVQGTFAADDIAIGSNKTIIGCSSGAHVQGHIGIGSGSSNVIVRNLTISGYGVGNCALDPSYDSGTGCSSGDDAISVNGSAHHVWFDHCAIKDGTDGNLDITNDANFVTVSWTKFSYTPRTDNQGDDSTGAAGHRFSNLVGGTDDPPTNWPNTIPLNVTWHHNWWADNVVERQPRVRYGRNHIFNNYYSSDTSNYCVRAGIEAQILLQGNYFDGVDSPHQFNSDSNETTAYIALGEGALANTYAGTTGDHEDEGGGDAWTDPPYDFSVDAASTIPATVMSGAGPH